MQSACLILADFWFYDEKCLAHLIDLLKMSTYDCAMPKLGMKGALVLSIALWALTVASRFNFNGLVYGLDYGLFHPDGSLYTFKTLTLMGQSQPDAALRVSEWYSLHAFKLQNIDPQTLYFNQNPSWAIYGSRLSYPILSVPFVALLGLNGMLVVPALSFLVLLLGVLFIGNHFKRLAPALVLITVLCISTTVTRWMLINSTDSLLVALTTIFTLMCIVRIQNRFWFPLALVIVLAGSFTRFSLLLWLAFALVLFINKNTMRSFAVAFIAIACFVPTLFQDFQSAVLPNEPNTSLLLKGIKLPLSMFRIAFIDIAQLAVLDRILLLTVAFAVFLAIVKWRSPSGKYFIATILMLWCTAGINGTPGVNFRYELPILPLMSWVILENWDRVSKLIGADTQT